MTIAKKKSSFSIVSAAAYSKEATEAQIHMAIVNYYSKFTECLVIHIPNQGQRTEGQTHFLKKLGLLPGAPDLLILGPCGRMMFLEVKSALGRLSKAQEAFRDWCATHNHYYFICRSLTDASHAAKLLGVA